MKIDFNRSDDLNARITIVIERSDYIPKLDDNLKNYSKKVKIKGFRSGKTPKSVLTKMYGKGMLEETVTSILNEKLFGYLEAEKLDIFGNPMMAADAEPVDFNPKVAEDYIFVFDLGLKPAFDLQYKYDIPLNLKRASIDHNLIDADILRYRRVFGAAEPIIEGKVEPHDRIGIKMSRILEDGMIEENFTENSVDLDRIPGEANSALLGLGVGASMQVDLEKFLGYTRSLLVKNTLGLETDPDPDKPLNYRITIETIARPQTTELTGDLLTKYVGQQITDESAFRKMLEDRENNAILMRNTDMRKMAVRLTLLQANPFQIAEEFLLRWVNSQRKQKIEPGSRDAEKLFREAKWSLLLNRISKEERLEVTEIDIQRQVKHWILENVNFKQYTQSEARKLVKDLNVNEYFMSTMRENALEEVVFIHILPQYQFNEMDATQEEFEHDFHDLHHQLFDHGEHSHE